MSKYFKSASVVSSQSVVCNTKLSFLSKKAHQNWFNMINAAKHFILQRIQVSIFQIAVKSSQIYIKPILHTGNLRLKVKIKSNTVQ